MDYEKLFQWFFVIAILVFCAVIIGIYMIILKIILLFAPEIHFLGLTIMH